MGIKWEYEQKIFKLAKTRYLPDFYLPQFDLWVECKPDIFLNKNGYPVKDNKCIHFAYGHKMTLLILAGYPGPFKKISQSRYSGCIVSPDGTMVNKMYWSQCPYCMVTGISYMGRGNELSHYPFCKKNGIESIWCGWDTEPLQKSLLMAITRPFPKRQKVPKVLLNKFF
jgi:hypothetical protein